MSYNPNNPNGQNTMANSAPVTIASDQTAVPVSATTLPLPTGAATETTLTSIKDTSGIKKITDALPAGTNLLGKTGIDQVTANANEVVTKTGSITNATLQAGSATIGALSANQSVNTSQVNAVTVLTGTGATGTGSQRVTVALDSATVAGSASLPAGSNLLGKVGIDQTTPGTTNLVAANITQLAGNTISSGVGATGTGTVRVVQANDAGKTILTASNFANTSGNNTLVGLVASNKLKIKAFSLTTTSTAAVTCIFQSNAGGTELWRVVLQAPTGVSVGANLNTVAPDYLFSTTAGQLLNLNLSSGQTVHWSVSYFVET